MMRFDPFTLEVLSTRLTALMDECATTMVRQSYSPMVRNSNDFACLLLDSEARSIAQSSLSIPIFTGTLPYTVQWLARHFENDLSDGDVLVTNDPWHGTGHLPDINVAMPVFYEGATVAWIASVAHSPDIGGRIWSTDSREIYEEGLFLPPLKLQVGHQPNETVYRIIHANVRVPMQVIGDLDAQVAAVRSAARRLVSWLERGEIGSLEVLGHELQLRSERAMRDAIASVPDGRYSAEVRTDAPDGDVVIRCSVDVDGDAITVDFEGTSPQVRSGINCVFHYARALSVYALKCALDPETPNNDGVLRAISVRAPEGTILNPRRPAPLSGRHVIGHLAPNVIFQALAGVVPNRVIADSAVPLWWIVLAGQDRDVPFSLSFALNGGLGARSTKPGLDVLSFPSNISSVPVEVCEATAPLRFIEKRLRPGSGGVGLHVGGRGQRVTVEVLGDDEVQLSVLGGGTEHAPRGICGGGEGLVSSASINEVPLRPKGSLIVSPGDVLTFETSGGGGYGVAEAEQTLVTGGA